MSKSNKRNRSAVSGPTRQSTTRSSVPTSHLALTERARQILKNYEDILPTTISKPLGELANRDYTPEVYRWLKITIDTAKPFIEAHKRKLAQLEKERLERERLEAERLSRVRRQQEEQRRIEEFCAAQAELQRQIAELNNFVATCNGSAIDFADLVASASEVLLHERPLAEIRHCSLMIRTVMNGFADTKQEQPV